MRPMARLYAKKAASRSAAVKMTQGGLYFLAESANLLLQKCEERLEIDSESERLKTCGGGLRSPSYRAMENHIQRKGMNKMNQTQTRSPRKRLLSLILAVILMIGLLPISAFATSASAQANDAEDTGYKYNIMFLDCGRKYFSVNSIKQIIDNASAAGFNYIQLAVGNDSLRFLLKDMSLEVGDKTYTSDAVTAAIETGNKQYSDSKGTTNSALSETDMDTIIAYAASKGMGVIPCVNTPGHMDAILSAATSLTGETCSYRGSARTIDVTNTTAVAFTQALLQKYISYFAGKGCKLFNMGADEYANDKFTGGSMGFGNLQDTGNYRYYVDYVNAVAKMIKTAGMKPMAFNDGIYFNSNTSSGTFDTDILICYWSNGWSSYAPMPAANLAAKGFKLINTNGDYYWVLGGTQCSADKAKEFDYKSFPAKQGDNGTIDNPSGSMFCIWCDYPDAETEDSVISKTAATIAAFGKALPSLKFCVKDSGGDTSGKMSAGERMTLTASKEAIWTVTQGEDVVHIVTTTRAAGVTGKSVTIEALKNGSATITATAGKETATFQVTVSDKGTEDIYVTVNGTATRTVDGSYPGPFNTDQPAIATVVTNVTNASEKDAKPVTTIESGKKYLIFNNRYQGVLTSTTNHWEPDYFSSYACLSLEKSGTDSLAQNTNTWTIEKSGTAYTVKNAGSKFLTIGGNTASVSSKSNSINLSYKGSYWNISQDSYYLNNLRDTRNAGGWKDNKAPTDEGSQWTLYQVTEGSKEQTTITFTGKSVGDTSVTIGGVKYNIHVTAEDLTKVTPLPLEYWITNAAISSVTGCETTTRTNKKSESYTVYYTPVAADRGGVASAGGVDVTTIAPADTERDGRTIYYWRCRMLDKTLTNTSTSGTQQQTNDGGDDETTSGIGFTKIRYYGGSWQVFTENNEWVTVDTTKIQLVAYYLENIKVSDEVESYAADWGNRGDNTEGGWLDANSYCTLSMQVVYEDATTNPTTTTANDLKAKTIVYGYWSANGGRGIGTVMLDGQEYEIYKVTSETGEATATISSGTNGNYKANVTNLTWDGNEMTVWEGEPSSSVTIHNDSNGFKTDGANANLCWDENKEAILIRVYVRAKATPDSLTVNYYDQADPKAPFYSYNIAVKQGTQFDDSFVYVPSTEQGKSGSLKGNTVTNINNLPQTVEWALEKMTQIKAQYRYSDYIFVDANRESDGKTVNLYYTFTREKTFVVDFGLPLVIRPADVNDRLSGNGVNLTGIEVANKTSFASITTDASINITYSLNKMIDQMDTFSVQYTGHIKNDQGNLQSGTVKYTLTIIPASNVYYEDSLATFTNGKGVAKDAKWSIDDQATADQKSATQALEQLGSSGIYGKDAAYNSSSMLSMGTAHKVTVTAAMAAKWSKDDTASAWPTAQFTFKGTGFDIISLTNNKSGAIFVDVYKAGEEKPTYSYIVDNYYGYNYNKDTGKWEVVNSGTENALYQIPVMKVTGLDYGEYNAVVTVFYDGLFNHTGDTQYSFWLDAIRIYDPMGVDRTEYKDDHEGYPQYIKLRDTLVDGTAKPDGTDKTVFIDGGSTADIMTTYANYGPNNEVYLMKGQAITFKIPQNANVDSIQIGAKAPDGKSAQMVVNTDNPVEISTATEMYYQIANAGGQFTITNTGDGILSLTNLKITYSAKDSVSLGALDTQEQENAVSLVRALFTAPAATFSPETFEADWGRAVRAGKRATLTVKTSADVESITVDGQSITSYTTRTQRTGWGWWSPKVTYHVFTYTITAPAQTTDYAVCAVNAEGTASEAVTATLTVKPTTWWNWWF